MHTEAQLVQPSCRCLVLECVLFYKVIVGNWKFNNKCLPSIMATGSSILGRRIFGPNTVARFCTPILFSFEWDCTSSRNLQQQSSLSALKHENDGQKCVWNDYVGHTCIYISKGCNWQLGGSWLASLILVFPVETWSHWSVSWFEFKWKYWWFI